MRKLLMILLPSMIATGALGCGPGDPSAMTQAAQRPAGEEHAGKDPGEPDSGTGVMVIKAGSATFAATLADNETAAAFKALLPMSVTMNDLNRNEKYGSLPRSLPVAATNPGTIRNGDIMLFGSGTLVLFYKTFSTSYAYTRIGSVDNPGGLESALGKGDITLTFEMNN